QQHLLGRKPSEFDLYVAGDDSGDGGGGGGAAAAVAIVRKTTPVTPATGFSTRERIIFGDHQQVFLRSSRTQVPEIALEISRLNYAEFPSVDPSSYANPTLLIRGL
ncbi:hypothetical protein V1478_001334, partial [Vespula squamosa]